jgi:hypothetical protein
VWGGGEIQWASRQHSLAGSTTGFARAGGCTLAAGQEEVEGPVRRGGDVGGTGGVEEEGAGWARARRGRQRGAERGPGKAASRGGQRPGLERAPWRQSVPATLLNTSLSSSMRETRAMGTWREGGRRRGGWPAGTRVAAAGPARALPRLPRRCSRRTAVLSPVQAPFNFSAAQLGASPDPGRPHPGRTHPGSTHPGSTRSSSTHPGSTHSSSTHSSSTHPGSTHSSSTHPGSTHSSSTHLEHLLEQGGDGVEAPLVHCIQALAVAAGARRRAGKQRGTRSAGACSSEVASAAQGRGV